MLVSSIARRLMPCLVLLHSVPQLCAQAALPAHQREWPQELVVHVGDIRTRISGEKLWTLSGIEHQNDVMAVQDSAYGTVLTIRNVGHLGTAHFLDVPGKPGEVEKEIVKSLRFTVDGKPLTKLQPQMDVRGKAFRMERESQIRALDLKSSVIVSDGIVLETVSLAATGSIDLQKGHPTMYAWTPDATVFAVGRDDQLLEDGKFQESGETASRVIPDMNWMAVFSPQSGKGSVVWLLNTPKNEECSFLLIDAPRIYRKVALYTFVDKVVTAGFEGTFQTAVGFFSAGPSDWKQQARKRAAEIRAKASTFTAGRASAGSLEEASR